MAHLLYVPVVHSSADMGSAASGYRSAFIARFGKQKWHERTEEYASIWRGILENLDAAIARHGRPYSQVKLYQDSLPVCGHEAAMVAELAGQGSENHKLLASLIARGAVLMGSESPQLLITEYRLLQTQGHTQEQADALLEERDRFIATRIEATLAEDELGVLFIGALHQVPRYLSARITVEYLPITRG
jgi:hypothetical protein